MQNWFIYLHCLSCLLFTASALWRALLCPPALEYLQHAFWMQKPWAFWRRENLAILTTPTRFQVFWTRHCECCFDRGMSMGWIVVKNQDHSAQTAESRIALASFGNLEWRGVVILKLEPQIMTCSYCSNPFWHLGSKPQCITPSTLHSCQAASGTLVELVWKGLRNLKICNMDPRFSHISATKRFSGPRFEPYQYQQGSRKSFPHSHVPCLFGPGQRKQRLTELPPEEGDEELDARVFSLRFRTCAEAERRKQPPFAWKSSSAIPMKHPALLFAAISEFQNKHGSKNVRHLSPPMSGPSSKRFEKLLALEVLLAFVLGLQKAPLRETPGTKRNSLQRLFSHLAS